jgi:single-stranded DNA-binding protein|nr:MAG TPA: Single stranded DNA binding protein [Caudoviricetes sp.]
MANRISLDGQVFQPETRYSQTTGKPMLNFNLSFYDGKTADGKTKYGSIRVRAFGPLAENIAKTITEKDRYIVEGHLSADKWEKDGQKHYQLVVIADDIGKAFNKFADDGKPVTVQQSAEDPAAGAPIPDEEIPF